MINKLVAWGIGLFLLTNTGLAAQAEILPAKDLHPGMVGYAETTTTGNVMTRFNVEILGVVPSGKGNPPQILARAYGGIISDTHGVIHGMSGSPVYVDGKLIGAVARGVGEDVLPYKFYITPAQAMEKIWKLPDHAAKLNKIGVPPIKIPSIKEYDEKVAKKKEEILKQVAMYTGKTEEDLKETKPLSGELGKKISDILSGTDDQNITEPTQQTKDEVTNESSKTNKTTIVNAGKEKSQTVINNADSKDKHEKIEDNKKKHEEETVTTALEKVEKTETEKETPSEGVTKADSKDLKAKKSSEPVKLQAHKEPIKVSEADISIDLPRGSSTDVAVENLETIEAEVEAESPNIDEDTASGITTESSENKDLVKKDRENAASTEQENDAKTDEKKDNGEADSSKANIADKAIEATKGNEADKPVKVDKKSEKNIKAASDGKESGNPKIISDKKNIIKAKDESKPVKVIDVATARNKIQESKKLTDNDKLMNVSLMSISKDNIERSLDNRKPLFAKGAMKYTFIIGFPDGAKEFLRRSLGVKSLDSMDLSSVEVNNGSDAIIDYSLKPGQAVGATLVYGDFAVGATGTVTARSGNKIVAFGHPMFYKGNVNYFMNAAKVIDSAGGILDGIQVASIGKIIGRINQDRYAGISGVLNEFPASLPVRVTVKDDDLGITETYGAKIAYDEDNIVALAPSIVYGAMNRTADRQLFGTARVKFSIANNVSEKGVFTRENMYYDALDVGEMSVSELTQALTDLVDNKEKVSNIYDVKVNIELSSKRKTATITSVTADKMDVSPGEVVTFNITLQPYRQGENIISVPYLIPENQPLGPMTFEVKGGGFVRLSDFMAQDNGDMTMAQQGDEVEDTTADKLDDLADVGRNNEIIVSPITSPFMNDKDQEKAIDKAYEFSQKLATMSKSERDAMERSKEVTHKTEYVIDNVRQITLNVVKHHKDD